MISTCYSKSHEGTDLGGGGGERLFQKGKQQILAKLETVHTSTRDVCFFLKYCTIKCVVQQCPVLKSINLED